MRGTVNFRSSCALAALVVAATLACRRQSDGNKSVDSRLQLLRAAVAAKHIARAETATDALEGLPAEGEAAVMLADLYVKVDPPEAAQRLKALVGTTGGAGPAGGRLGRGPHRGPMGRLGEQSLPGRAGGFRPGGGLRRTRGRSRRASQGAAWSVQHVLRSRGPAGCATLSVGGQSHAQPGRSQAGAAGAGPGPAGRRRGPARHCARGLRGGVAIVRGQAGFGASFGAGLDRPSESADPGPAGARPSRKVEICRSRQWTRSSRRGSSISGRTRGSRVAGGWQSCSCCAGIRRGRSRPWPAWKPRSRRPSWPGTSRSSAARRWRRHVFDCWSRISAIVAAAALLGSAGCSEKSPDLAGTDLDDTAQVTLALANTPAEVGCVVIQIAGATTIHLRFPNENSNSTFRLTRLPVGVAVFTVEAFSEACPALNPASVATFVGGPVAVTLRPGLNDSFTIFMRRAAQVSVDVDFGAPGRRPPAPPRDWRARWTRIAAAAAASCPRRPTRASAPAPPRWLRSAPSP